MDESINKGRVLIVDDDPQVVRSVARLLERAGYAAVTADSGAGALAELDHQRLDLLLADIGMPEMSGLELVRRTRARAPALPVILITGAPAVQSAVEAIELGVLRYLIKPVQPAELIEVVGKAIVMGKMVELRRGGWDGEAVKLQAHFDSAIDRLWMAYQPIVRADGSLFGYEALLRSDEPALPHPGAVLQAAETLGRLAELGRTIRHRAAAAFSAPAPVTLFVNLHPHDLLDDRLYAHDGPLAALGRRVILEITERASLSEIPDIRARLSSLRKLGFRVALDDLGAGYAGLTSLPLLEPEIVKIDMSLIRDVDSQPMKRKLVGAVASLGREMRTEVVAEGVETRAEAETLRELGCSLLQGYLIGRPTRELVVPATISPHADGRPAADGPALTPAAS